MKQTTIRAAAQAMFPPAGGAAVGGPARGPAA